MQYWEDRQDNRTQLILVSNEAVYAQQLRQNQAATLIGQLRTGTSPATVFGEDASHIVLRNTSRVLLSSADDDIEFSVRDGNSTSTINLSIQDEGIRNEVLDAIEQVGNGRFKRYTDQYNRPRAAFGALLALSVIGFLTKVTASAATAIQASGGYEAEGRRTGAKQALAWVLELLGSTGVTVIGALLALLAAWILVQRLRSPPFLQILQTRPYKPQPLIVTGVKYAALIGAWILLLPGLLR